jgi:Tol biopolymer transport system component
VAVEVDNLLDVRGSDAGLVVLDRRGKVVAVQDPRLGPSSGTLPVWSPDGAAIAYASEGSADNSIEIWTVGAGTASVHLRTGVGAGQCLWSPTGAAVLCDSARAGDVGNTWSVTNAKAGPVVSLPGPGFAIDWFRG